MPWPATGTDAFEKPFPCRTRQISLPVAGSYDTTQRAPGTTICVAPPASKTSGVAYAFFMSYRAPSSGGRLVFQATLPVFVSSAARYCWSHPSRTSTSRPL